LLPNYVIAGAPKSGTTSIFHWLSQHPEVCASSRKEVQFFMDRDSSVFHPEANFIDHGISAYHQFFTAFDDKRHRIAIEATPGYIYQKTAITAFAKELPQTQIIFILREPASRLYSIYRYFTQNRGELDQNISFREFIQKIKDKDEDLQWNEFLRDGIMHGAYMEYLQKWIDACGKDRIIVLPFEDIAKDEKAFTKKLATSLGIDDAFYETFEFQSQNKTVQINNQLIHKIARVASAAVPFGPIRDTLRNTYFKINGKSQHKNKDEEVQSVLEELRAFYQPYNKSLSQVFNLKLNGWK